MDVFNTGLVTNGVYSLSDSSDTKVYKDNNTAFESLLNSAISMYQQADEYQRNAEEAEVNFAMGYSDSTVDLALAQQKASIALQYTVKVTNSVLDAYKELLNMQL